MNLLFTFLFGFVLGEHILVNHRHRNFKLIPEQYLKEARENLVVIYGHTSHGSQVTSGLEGLQSFLNGNTKSSEFSGFENLFNVDTSNKEEPTDDSTLRFWDRYGNFGSEWDYGSESIYSIAGAPKDLSKSYSRSSLSAVKSALDSRSITIPQFDTIDESNFESDIPDWFTAGLLLLNHPDFQSSKLNVIMLSWCAPHNEEDTTTYLEAMFELEKWYNTAFPNGKKVHFVYFTARTELSGNFLDDEYVTTSNMIRNFTATHSKILFDFGDFEQWDPNNNHYPNGDEDCMDHDLNENWGEKYMEDNGGSSGDGVNYFTTSCAHCENCQILGAEKAKGMWWLLARIAGWSECDSEKALDPNYQCGDDPDDPNPIEGSGKTITISISLLLGLFSIFFF